jgi:hypothetical protein
MVIDGVVSQDVAERILRAYQAAIDERGSA